jgi:hypothetical protein
LAMPSRPPSLVPNGLLFENKKFVSADGNNWPPCLVFVSVANVDTHQRQSQLQLVQGTIPRMAMILAMPPLLQILRTQRNQN